MGPGNDTTRAAMFAAHVEFPFRFGARHRSGGAAEWTGVRARLFRHRCQMTRD